MATRNQGVCGSFNNGIAVVTGIIGGITGFNLNGGQAGATTEGIAADACHAVWDGDGGQAAAIPVFVNCLISIACKLNDRKVMS